MAAFELLVHSTEGSAGVWHPLPFGEPGSSGSWRQRCLPGASAIHVVLKDRDGVGLRAEIPAEGGETVPIYAEVDEDGRPSMWSPGLQVLTLPPDERFAPAAPNVLAGTTNLDLALFIDGTSRRFFLEESDEARRVTSRPLLEDPEQCRRRSGS